MIISENFVLDSINDEVVKGKTFAEIKQAVASAKYNPGSPAFILTHNSPAPIRVGTGLSLSKEDLLLRI